MGLPPISTLVIALAVFVSGRELSSSSQQQQTPVDFDCPEEFGYYAHPTDCTQYYVCVFGGALLESCTGGLMYSHELQTCDWPRNVGCAPGQQQALQQQEIIQNSRQQLRQDARQQELRQELARHEQRQQEARQDLRQQEAIRQQEARQEFRQQEARQEYRQEPRQELRPEYRQVQEALRQPKQQQQQILQQVVDNRGRQRAQIAVTKADLYNTEEEELGPAVEDLEIDRQQRVYRGQPSTLGQVASDRDGLTHSNAIPVPATGGRDKLSVISYGAQQQYNSLNKRRRTDGITDSDHNFLTNSSRVRMKRDSDPSYQQKLGPRSFQRKKNKKHDRRKREQSIQKTAANNNTLNDTATSSTSNSQGQTEITHKSNNDDVEEEEQEEEQEEEEEGEESEDDDDDDDGEEELDNAEEVQSEEENNEEDKNSKDSLEKPFTGTESNETNKSTAYNDFKIDFPNPPSSWESFEDFKSSFGDIDFDVEKFLEELKADSFDEDIFDNNKRKKQQERSNQQTEEAQKPATVPLIIIPPSLNASEVKFELFFPRELANNISMSNISSISLSSTVVTPLIDNNYMIKTFTLPMPNTTFKAYEANLPSSGFREGQDSINYALRRTDDEVTNEDMNEHKVTNWRSHNREAHRPRSGVRSHGQLRRNMWRGKTTRERKPLRGPSRGNARFTLKIPRYFVLNTTPNYYRDPKPHFDTQNPTPAYEVKNSQQEITPKFNGLNVKPTVLTDNQEYTYLYHRPNKNNINQMKSFEATTPRQTFESERNDNAKYSDRGQSIAYEQNPVYRERLNRGYKFYGTGSKSETISGPQSTIKPIVVGNPNFFENINNPVYPVKFVSDVTNNNKEYKTDYLINSLPTEIPPYQIQTYQQLTSPTPNFKNGNTQTEKGTTDPKNYGSYTTESTFLYDGQFENNNNNNEDWFKRNHSKHHISPKTRIGSSLAYPYLSHNTEPTFPSFRYTSKSNREEFNKIQESTTDNNRKTGWENPSSLVSYRQLNKTTFPDDNENQQHIKIDDRFNTTTSYQVSIQQQYPHNHKGTHPSTSESLKESSEVSHSRDMSNSSVTSKNPSSYFYVNQKIGPVKKIAIFNNIPSETSSDDDYDYYNDYDEEDYEDVSNETTPKPPKMPKTLQNIDYQEFEDSEYEDYNDGENDYDDESKEDFEDERGSEEDYYDENEEKEEIKEEETKNVNIEAKSQEGSMERPLTVTPRPGCIFAGRNENGQKRLLCPRRNSTDRPNTTADDQTNSEQTRRTITLLRASVQPVQQAYDNRGYNTSRYIQQQQQQQYTDPNYYSVYDEEAEQYKDIADYAQYIQQNKQDIYTRKKPSVEIVQQEPVQRGATYQKNKYSTQPENIYQSVTPQEYDTYSIQNNDDLYRQVQTKSSTRNNLRNRGSQTYTVSPNDAEPAPAPVATSPPRGTLPPNRGRPTLKPSNSVVSKAAEFVDIFRYPPSRPENVYPTPQVDKTAAKCRKDVCLLPDCYCGGKDIPGDLTPEETPQIVLLTFDDSVNDLNKGLYSDLFDKGRVNPNGCPISATFYVSHEWTDYSQVQNLYAGGHEIASHSVSHSFGEQFSQKKWTREIAGQREILAAYGGVKLEDIRGMRAPFLAVGGNKMFKMLYDSNFTYDSSMPVYENRPPSWPYTLDYKVFHDCMIPPCPTKSYPGVWEVPMVMWQDLNGGRCSMGDACSNPPTAEGVYKMLIKNFERHFTTNRAPFGLFYHAAWFTQPHHKEGFISFLDTINKMPEVWLITNWQAIQWVRDPTPLSRLGSFAPFQCNYQDRPKKCNNPKVCNLWHKSGVRYMRTCQVCPDIYPWTGKSGVRNSRVDNDLE